MEIEGDYVKNLEKEIAALFEENPVEHIAVKVGKGDKILYETYKNADSKTLFDMASVTKIMVTTTLCLMALDKGLLSVDDEVNKFFPTEKPLTIKNLLTHTCGIGHKSLNVAGNTYDNVAEYILNIPQDIPIGSDVLYSCPGFILLGKILEKVYGKSLDRCFDEYVAPVLEYEKTSFKPSERENIVNPNTDDSQKGIVNDYNCRFLGAVAGNAGLFSCVDDVTKFAKMLMNCGSPLIKKETFLNAAQNYTEGMREARGLGFVYVDEKYKQTGGLFEIGSVGHCGHTGQSVFVDYRTGFYVIILSDVTLSTIKKYGRDNYDEVMNIRARLHSAIKKDLESER